MASCLWNNLNMPVAMALLLLLMVGSGCVLGDNYNNGRDYNNRATRPGSYCENLSPQQFIEMDHIMGMWYGAEVINHHDGGNGEHIYDTCVMIHLAEVSDEISATEQYMPRDRNQGYNQEHRYNRDRDQARYLRLTWDEKGASLEYLLRFNNNQTGYWQSAAPQHGTMTERYYKQFTGTVQVMKAVGNHLVLTFCQTAPNHQMFTVILARQRNSLTYDEIKSIKNLLNYRRLSISSVRRVCLNGAASLFNSKTGVLLALVSLYGMLRSLVASKQQ